MFSPTKLDFISIPLAHAPGDEFRTQASVFEEIFMVFLVLGTLIGIVVITYMLYYAFKYREGKEGKISEDEGRPILGELPTGGEGGKKLFISFAISAIIVVTLIVWTYSWILYVEAGPIDDSEDQLEIKVTGFQFGWEFEYPNGETLRNELVVPEGEVVVLHVTSNDVWHTFGVPELRIKSDAIPGQTARTWFIADETGEFTAYCYELCGVGHSHMDATVTVVDHEEFEEWYNGTDNPGLEQNTTSIGN